MNLVDDPWIPVLSAQGPQELGLAEVFRGSSKIMGLASGNVIIDAALLRLLMAVDLAAHRTTHDDWLTGHRSSFELFDPVVPFLQNAAMAQFWGLKGATSLIGTLERPNGSPETIVHSTRSALANARGAVLTPAQAARYLVMRQQYSTGGIQSFPARAAFGLKSSSASSTVANQAPLLYAEGPTLEHTLAANRIDDGSADSFHFTWPSGTQPYTSGSPQGIVDTLTWQARSMLLQRRGDGMVDAYQCSDGIRYGELQPALLPHTTFEQKTKGADWTVRGAHHHRPGWRQILDAYAVGSPGLLSRLPAPAPAPALRLRMIGLSSFQSRLDGYVDARLPLPRISPDEAAALSAAIGQTYKEASSAVGAAAAALGSSDWGDRRRPDAIAQLADAVERIASNVVSGLIPVEVGISELAATGTEAAYDVAAAHTGAFPAVAGKIRARVLDRATKASAQKAN